MRVERRVSRSITNFQVRGIAISESIKKKRGSDVRFVLDFPSKEILGLEDTTGKKIHLEPATTGSIQRENPFRQSEVVNRFAYTIRYEKFPYLLLVRFLFPFHSLHFSE